MCIRDRASIKGYKIIIIMPETASIERIKTMEAYGAKVILVSKDEDMEGARDLAKTLESDGKGLVLDQFSNKANYMAHFNGTGPEIWHQTNGEVTHFVSAMGTTGTITGVSMFLKSMNKNIKIIGVQPEYGSKIPGIRRWSQEYVPVIRKNAIIDEIIDINQLDAEETSKDLSRKYSNSAQSKNKVLIEFGSNSKPFISFFSFVLKLGRYITLKQRCCSVHCWQRK